MHPAEIWRKSGRWDAIGDEMFRLRDRKGAEFALGVTHEEVFALLATELSLLPGTAADLVPDPDQVPRRAPAKGRAAPGARVHHEGLLHASISTARAGHRRSTSTTSPTCASSGAWASTRWTSRHLRGSWAAPSRWSSWCPAPPARIGLLPAPRAAIGPTWNGPPRASIPWRTPTTCPASRNSTHLGYGRSPNWLRAFRMTPTPSVR